MRSLRTRLALTLVALIAVTVAAIGLGVYAFVDSSLRASAIADARRQADFDLSVLFPAADPAPSDAASFGASGLPQQFRLRGTGEVIADFGDGAPWTPTRLAGALDQLSPELRAIVGRGELGYAWQPVAGQPSLVVGGRAGASSPSLYFVHSAQDV